MSKQTKIPTALLVVLLSISTGGYAENHALTATIIGTTAGTISSVAMYRYLKRKRELQVMIKNKNSKKQILQKTITFGLIAGTIIGVAANYLLNSTDLTTTEEQNEYEEIIEKIDQINADIEQIHKYLQQNHSSIHADIQNGAHGRFL